VAVVFLCSQLVLGLTPLSLLDPSSASRSRVEDAIKQLQELYKARAAVKALPQ